MKFFPDPAEYSEKRLFCLDLLRGLDMFYLAALSGVLRSLFDGLGCPAAATFLARHQWGGFTLYDLIMPLFIFMCGAAVPLALGRRLDADGRATPAFHRHVWSRFALLWVLGMLTQGDLQTLDLHQLSPYNNTLQTIAVGYVVAAYVLLIRSWAVKLAIPLLLALGYGLVVHFGGDYTKAGNVTQPVELAILNVFLPADNLGTKHIVDWGYTWFLPSMMFPVIALAGAFATLLLTAKDRNEWRKAGSVFAFGAALLGAGLGLEAAGVQCVKHIFTVSFTFQAIGWSLLALAALYVLTDIWKFRRGTGILLLYGQSALAAYMIEGLLRKSCTAASERLFLGFKQFVPTAQADTVTALGSAVVITYALVVWRRAKAAAAGK